MDVGGGAGQGRCSPTSLSGGCGLAKTVSVFGSQVTVIALPLAAVLVLHASTFQVVPDAERVAGVLDAYADLVGRVDRRLLAVRIWLAAMAPARLYAAARDVRTRAAVAATLPDRAAEADRLRELVNA